MSEQEITDSIVRPSDMSEKPSAEISEQARKLYDELFPTSDMPQVLEDIQRHLDAYAESIKQSRDKLVEALMDCPPIEPREPFDDARPDGYLESLNDWYHHNEDAVRWFLENMPKRSKPALKLKG